jgi:hypothetical protein
MDTWICSKCGEEHLGVPLSFAADFPDAYANLTQADRAKRAECSSDQCIIDDGTFSVRGLIEIPIHGQDTPFLWGVWANLHRDDFITIQESWHEEGREMKLGPFKGRMANQLSIYPNTLNLKISVIIQPVGARPIFELNEDHLLADQQRLGISLDRARQMAADLLHAQNVQ